MVAGAFFLAPNLDACYDGNSGNNMAEVVL